MSQPFLDFPYLNSLFATAQQAFVRLTHKLGRIHPGWKKLRDLVRERLDVVPYLAADELAREVLVPPVPPEAMDSFCRLLPYLDPPSVQVATCQGRTVLFRNLSSLPRAVRPRKPRVEPLPTPDLEPAEARQAALDLLGDKNLRLGLDSVVALLRGRPQKKLEAHRQRPAYGALSHWDARSLRGVLDDLVARGELERTRILLYGREGHVLTRREA